MTKSLNNPHRKETILMIAEEAFAQYSFSGASIRLITKRLGANSAMISYYFGSKEGLYFDIFKLRLNEAIEEVNKFQKLDLTPAEKLNAYLVAYIKRVAANQNFHRLLCNELVAAQHPSIIAQVSAARKRIYNFLLKLIESGIAKGCFKNIDAEIFVLDILALIRSVLTDHLNTDIDLCRSPGEDLTARIVAYLMSSVSIDHQSKIKTKSYV
jgi:TetR/AcrR family transcriptional regulator